MFKLHICFCALTAFKFEFELHGCTHALVTGLRLTRRVFVHLRCRNRVLLESLAQLCAKVRVLEIPGSAKIRKTRGVGKGYA